MDRASGSLQSALTVTQGGTMRTTSKNRSRSLVLALLASLGAGVAIADMNGGKASAAARFEFERAACLRGQTAQDRDTCLREAGAALAQARRGGLQTEDASRFDANRLQRCEPLPEAQRRDCVARMQGEGTVSGSVAEGGIYRELVIEIEFGEHDAAEHRH
jgi:hypothetical protein